MKKLYISFLPGVFIFSMLFGCSTSKTMVNTQTVKHLEINKFLGEWYEIARFPHSFEKGLVGVTATYLMQENGKIEVLNQVYKNTLDGELKKAIGKAKIPDTNFPANLKVSFFWIFYADYLVLELDSTNYEWAAIGSHSSNYLWILSRKPRMEDPVYHEIVGKLKARGYDIEKLIMVEQKTQ